MRMISISCIFLMLRSVWRALILIVVKLSLLMGPTV